MKKLLYIDLFCGAGGTSTGVNSARIGGQRCAEVIACVNHDTNAIASHAANHPDAIHFTEDIRTLDLAPLIEHLQKCRAANPDSLTVLWASLECTNFSKAKGGQPRDADSRTLAEHLFRYIEAINPDYIQIENVEEFMSWGEVDANGKPISMDKGRSYLRWVNNVKKYGYKFDYRIMNAADYGAYTSRKRFFGIFAKNGLPITFPTPTHSKNGTNDLFCQLERWKSVRECLDLKDEGESIFSRKKPLSEKTLGRIYAGLIKFVGGGKDAFLIKYNSMSKSGKYTPPSIDEPCPTVVTQNRLGIASVQFLSKYYGGTPAGKNISIDEPAGTITTHDHHAFISAYYGNGHNHSVKSPCPTVTTVDRFALVKIQFLDAQYGNGTPTSIEAPSGCITTNPKQNLISVKPLIGRTTDQIPAHLVTTQTGEIAIAVYDTDSPMTVKIKEFMSLYCIVDIKMRMLKIPELKKIMGFPEDYILIGTQADQKKFIGNAVEVNMARVICETLYYELQKLNRKELKELLDNELCAVCPFMHGEIDRKCDSVCEGEYCDEALNNYLEEHPDYDERV